MNRAPLLAALLMPLFGVAQGASAAPYALVQGPKSVVKAPLFSEKFATLTVASIDDQVVTLEELSDAIAASHESHAAGSKASTRDFKAVLDRLIGGKLLLLEAREVGLDDNPEIQAAVAKYADTLARTILKRQLTWSVPPDAREVKKIFRDKVREWKLKSVLFAREDDAKAMVASLMAGKGFDELAKQAIAEKKATGDEGAQYVSAKSQALPQVLAALGGLQKSKSSAVIKVDKGFTILKLEGYRYPKDAAALAAARDESLEHRRDVALKKEYKALLKKYGRIDKTLFDSIDFEAEKPGWAALAKDQRALVRFEGDKPVTVADLSAELAPNFFHGVESAIKEKQVNEKKEPLFETLLYKRLFGAEAARRKVAATHEYLRSVAEHRDSLVFGVFVEKYIMPGVKVTEDDGKKYYQDHKADFTYSEFYTLDSLAFASGKAAQAAFDKLGAGTDFKWLKGNADGQIAEDKRKLDFNGTTMSAKGLSPELAKGLAGAKTGELKLVTSGGQHFLLRVKQVTPASEQPYLEARAVIAKKVSAEKLNQALDDWVGRLRKAHEIKVFVTQIVI